MTEAIWTSTDWLNGDDWLEVKQRLCQEEKGLRRRPGGPSHEELER